MALILETLDDLSIDDSKVVEVTASEVEKDDIPLSESESENEPDTPSKVEPKGTERKQQINAAWDDAFATSAKTWAEKDDAKIKDIDQSLLNIRGLMSRFEADNVIDSPREYQMELFERAKNENVIAVLPTGSGKTLIAVLLLQHTIEKELEDRKNGQPRRLSFFLVELATLVLQQGSVLEKNLAYPIEQFCGDMNVDSWGKATWKEHFEKNLVIVLTAEVLCNCLAAGFITMQEINLLILDEAHHTKKNHPYARIIRDFYMPTAKANRPKIFGTTASPIDTRGDCVKAADKLEKLLHAKIATVQDFSELERYVRPPIELVNTYPRLPKPYATPICAELEGKYGSNRLISDIILKAKLLAAALGNWCGDKWLVMSMTSQEGEKLEWKSERRFATDPISRATFDKELEEIKGAKGIVAAGIGTSILREPKLEFPDLSHKVLQLKGILDHAYEENPGTRAIVFVEKRATARLLLHVFKIHRPLGMHPGLLIGSQHQDSGDQKVSIREQLSNMNLFKEGKMNLLFATSVAEEGLDIPLCNLVIRFDLYKTMIQYMQSRGRARHKESRYIHMLEEGHAKQWGLYMDVQMEERILRQFCSSQPEDRLLQAIDADLDAELLRHGVGDVYTEPSTGAKLLFGTVLGQLAYFAACVPQSVEMSTRVDYIISTRGKNFVCEVILPYGSPLKFMIGKEFSRKSLAKRSAAFEACLELRKRGLLDENLLPIYHKQLPAMRNAHLALHSRKGNAYELILKPKFWEKGWGVTPTQLYALIVKAENPEASEHAIGPILLLTRDPLPTVPSFPVWPRPGVILNMNLTNLKGTVTMSETELKAIHEYTLRTYKDLFNKGFEDNITKMSYWLAPVDMTRLDPIIAEPRKLIDWQVVSSVQTTSKILWSKAMPPAELENKFFVDDFNGGHRYYSLGLDQSLTANSLPPEGVVKKNDMSTIVGWTSSLWRKARDKMTYDPNQPVLKAYKLPLRRNWLDDWTDDDLAERTKAWICPEPLRISAIPLPIVVMSYILPAIIWRIDAYLVALEACEMLNLQITPELALEAMTKDSDNTDQHSEQQIQLQRGMGKNYERLEFIGDAFLKMATSISLFVVNAGDDEFESHVNRMVMICNKNLFTHAIDNKLYQYIRTEGFNRRTWYPEGLILKEGKGANAKRLTSAETDDRSNKHQLRTHHLNDKTIADVCEALIGAALLTEKDAGCMDMAVKAVTILVKNAHHEAQCWDDYYAQYRKPTYQTTEASAAQISVANQVELTTGYHFKYPRLLASAFTHPSWPMTWGYVPNYQRLEFLGDALLDMTSINFLFYRYPDKDPQWLTEHKMAMVSNKFLGALCVKLKFHRFLKKNSDSLIYEIKNYVEAIEEAEAASNGARDYWTTATDPPKSLPDMVEAYLGAIFVDSGLKFGVVEEFFESHVRWFFEDMSIYDTFANSHPTTFLGNLLTNTFHCSHYSIQAREMPAALDGGPTRVTAGVMVHFKIISEDHSSSSKYAKIRASKKAIAVLEEMTIKEFKEKYNCDCNVQRNADGQAVVPTEEMIGTAI